VYKVDNAVILAAGTASRFAPLSYERPKALIEVRGEILIERQIRQLKEAGIAQVIIVVGYMKEQFLYLREKFDVIIVENDAFLTRNNNSSIFAARDYIKNSYICSSDNYFGENPFESEVDESYYAAIYSDGKTKEWCMTEDEKGYIDSVSIGGEKSWFMLGHVFWSEKFSKVFLEILNDIYDKPETRDLLWESIYINHLDTLKMKMRRYNSDAIFEFDTLDELREFDRSYVTDSRSVILKNIATELDCKEEDIVCIAAYKDSANAAVGIRFYVHGTRYEYTYAMKELKRIG